ncbi:Spore maturation protein B [Poriferisphaera corsica]|uniref:Spore maturation protein B n=1 Tax=Poriferisphaera corsica TaxID=2528020 RepID=A0A517YXZ4_9BACT|nr:spore maturation protein [Poriferisphaera corsica]QDU35103.1 Spore maturation protein B [Poriferisphaera corsica]
MEAIKELMNMASLFIIPAMLLFIPLYGLFKRVPVYEVFVEGAKEGFDIAVMIIPYLIAILFAIGMFRASGAMAFLMDGLRPALSFVGIPPEILPMAIARPLTGSGATAILVDIVNENGPESLISRMAAVISGSTETTFYVIAVYFGAIGVKKIRHALVVGLIADVTAILLAIYVVKWLFG